VWRASVVKSVSTGQTHATGLPKFFSTGAAQMKRSFLLFCALCAVLMTDAGSAVAAVQSAGDDFPAAFNTDPPDSHPPTPAEMLPLIEVPEGFTVTLFAGEPDVQQPINMEFDDRGRLWVAENYTYSGGPYETKLRDRIVILHDTDGDGRHDTRKVFWDKGFMLTSLTWGFGGVWILNDGTLSFIPDRDGDDVPDSDPVVMLDGWSRDCGHNFVSGLTWGPDGWLYGRHGIVDTSWPGTPGTPREQRVFMNCGVWRFHPLRQVVEVVCNGTTNPWGLDYNADNQFFMTNNVQGHLWHVIPGARYQRMYGRDFNPHAYELMEMTADHYHWDTKLKWTDSRDGKANDLGGGHSHVGGLIYHGENFPAAYRGKIFMCNTHGRRINVNRLDREGSGYVGRREPDFMLVKTPWFRGVDLKMGPEGAIYVSDWSDNGECHDHDGIHRTSGRIYRIAYGTPGRVDVEAVRKSKETPRPGWFVRRDIRWNQEQTREHAFASFPLLDGKSLGVADLGWLEAIDQLSTERLEGALQSADPLVRAAAVHLAASAAVDRPRLQQNLQALAATSQPANVLLALVSALQKLEPEPRRETAVILLKNPANAATIQSENQLTLMTWYGIEPLAGDPALLPLLSPIPKLQQFAVRRMAHRLAAGESAVGAAALAMIAGRARGDAVEQARAVELLGAFRVGLAGLARIDAPENWSEVDRALRSAGNAEMARAADGLAALFGDGTALAELRALAADSAADPLARQQAIQALAQAKDADSVSLLIRLLNDKAAYDAAISALAAFDNPEIATELVQRLPGFKDGNRGLAIDTLSSRKAWADRLIAAISADRIPARELTAAQVRQLLAFNDPQIREVLEARWGVVQETPEARLAAIEKWRSVLTPEKLAGASLEQGAELFKQSCASCHRLYGEGRNIGPDLTGANRSNLEYLLLNLIDPSAVVPRQFTTSVIVLQDGRVLTGVVVSTTERTLVVQTDREQITLARSDIEETRDTGKSLMPDGMLDKLSEDQVRDLFGFMMLRK
jgi:putative membrane-bound dehydrogenase-like protein